MTERLRVLLVDDIGVHKNRPNATLQITPTEFVVETPKGDEERFNRERHNLIKPEL